MLKEILQKQKNAVEENRRWFQGPDMGLFAWTDNGNNIVRFQLIYSAYGTERTLEWSQDRGLRNFHSETFRYGSAVLSSETDFELDSLKKEFEALSSNIDKGIRSFVLRTLSGQAPMVHQSTATHSLSRPDWTFMLILAFILLSGIALIGLVSAV